MNQPEEDRAVVFLSGSPAGLRQIEQDVAAVLESEPHTVVVDLAAVTRVTSGMVTALLRTKRHCSSRGVDVRLRNPSRRCRQVLERAGLLGVVPVEPCRQEDEAAPGISRFDLVCEPEVEETVLTLARSWAEDRVLAAPARERLTALVRAATGHGLSFAPRSVSLRLRWLDADRVRLDLRWRGGSDTATVAPTGGGLDATIATLDTFAEAWGIAEGPGGWVLWVVLDTR